MTFLTTDLLFVSTTISDKPSPQLVLSCLLAVQRGGSCSLKAACVYWCVLHTAE